MFPVELFKKVNGYSNEYWGWGFEDDDLLMRLTEQNILTDFKTYEVPKTQHQVYIYTEMKVIFNVLILLI